MTAETKRDAGPDREDARTTTEHDLAQRKMGDNDLQGDDQAQVRNQRHAQPDAKREPDKDVMETLKKSDKDVRAERELGKGRRSEE